MDLIISMTGSKKRARHFGAQSLARTLEAVKNLKPNIVLFSAGGNDIVGSEISGYLNHKISKPSSLIKDDIFKDRLSSMEIAIRVFIEQVHKKNRKAHIFMDGYGNAKVNNKGYRLIIKWAGPWLLPSLAEKAIVAKKDHEKIVKYLVDHCFVCSGQFV